MDEITDLSRGVETSVYTGLKEALDGGRPLKGAHMRHDIRGFCDQRLVAGEERACVAQHWDSEE